MLNKVHNFIITQTIRNAMIYYKMIHFCHLTGKPARALNVCIHTYNTNKIYCNDFLNIVIGSEKLSREMSKNMR